MSGKWGPVRKHRGGTVGSGLFAEKAPSSLLYSPNSKKAPLCRRACEHSLSVCGAGIVFLLDVLSFCRRLRTTK